MKTCVTHTSERESPTIQGLPRPASAGTEKLWHAPLVLGHCIPSLGNQSPPERPACGSEASRADDGAAKEDIVNPFVAVPAFRSLHNQLHFADRPALPMVARPIGSSGLSPYLHGPKRSPHCPATTASPRCAPTGDTPSTSPGKSGRRPSQMSPAYWTPLPKTLILETSEERRSPARPPSCPGPKAQRLLTSVCGERP